MVQVRIKQNESITHALSRFKEKCKKAGLKEDIRKHSRYVKPSERRRKKQRNNKND